MYTFEVSCYAEDLQFLLDYTNDCPELQNYNFDTLETTTCGDESYITFAFETQQQALAVAAFFSAIATNSINDALTNENAPDVLVHNLQVSAVTLD